MRSWRTRAFSSARASRDGWRRPGSHCGCTALADDPRFRDPPPSPVPDVSSSLCMPMKDENGRVQGVLCIRRRVPTPLFTEEDLRLFSIFATQAGLAINNAHLYAKLSHKLQELSTLSALTETVSSTLDLDQVLNQVADAIVDVVHFDRCRIYLADLETGASRRGSRAASPGSAAGAPEPEFAPGEGVIGQVAQAQTPLLVETGRGDAGTARLRAGAGHGVVLRPADRGARALHRRHRGQQQWAAAARAGRHRNAVHLRPSGGHRHRERPLPRRPGAALLRIGHAV